MRLAVMTVDSVTQIDVFRSLSYQVVIESHRLMCLDLSYQAAQHVLSAPVTSALHLLRDISQNFPTRARSVSSPGHLAC